MRILFSERELYRDLVKQNLNNVILMRSWVKKLQKLILFEKILLSLNNFYFILFAEDRGLLSQIQVTPALKGWQGEN
jgi:tRNA A22 N-methylase